MFVPQSLGDLQGIVEQRLEEGMQLEFKRQLPESQKNDDLAVVLCAMANSEGGVIIYGVEEDKATRASRLTPFPLSGAGNRVNLVARSALDGPVELTEVRTICASGQEGFLVVVVPKSDRAPHFVHGTAWGRTPKGNSRLTRRQIGELFAASPGFAEEFGLVMGRPGRVVAQVEVEPYQETDSRGRLRTLRREYLVFRNDGDLDVYHVRWEWCLESPETNVPHVLQDPFPLEVLPASVRVRVLTLSTSETERNLRVRTCWEDKTGTEHQQSWPIVFY